MNNILRGALLAIIAMIVFPIASCYYRERSQFAPADAYRYVQDGMTKQQVIDALGQPHRQAGPDQWYYDRDDPLFFLQFGFNHDHLSVSFDEDGRVNWISL